MKSNPDKIAVIDIGSNSVRLFVFAIAQGKIEQLAAEKFFCGLGRDLGITGKLNADSIALTLDALHGFRRELARHDINREIVIGTAALREAKDANEFIDRVKSETEFHIQIIEGEEEARLAALGILSQRPGAVGVVADFGGGSLELARIGRGEVHEKISLKLGAHYLKAMGKDESEIERKLNAALGRQPVFGNPSRLFLIGGSWRSLAKACLGHDEVEGVHFDGTEIIQFCRGLEAEPPSRLMDVYGMERQRAEIMDVSALMLRKLIEILNPASIEISTAGIRDGIAYDYMLNHSSDRSD